MTCYYHKWMQNTTDHILKHKFSNLYFIYSHFLLLGILKEDQSIDIEQTIQKLAELALVYAKAGILFAVFGLSEF